MDELDPTRIESELRGKTLITYWYVIRRGSNPIGVRQVQRSLGFSSPSVALHHLEKLRELGLLKKNPTGEYVLVEEVKVGFLKFFVKFGRFMLPRYLFYAVLLTTMLVGYLVLYQQPFTIHNIVALLFGIIAAGILWYETVKVIRQAPF